MALRTLLRSRLATAPARGLAVRALPPLGAPCLRERAKPIPEAMFGTPALDAIVADLVDTMRDANGAGIAGPQIGEGWRIFVVEGSGANPRYPYKPKLPLTVFVNPELEVVDEAPMEIFEGCLSIPGVRGRVARGPGAPEPPRRAVVLALDVGELVGVEDGVVAPGPGVAPGLGEAQALALHEHV